MELKKLLQFSSGPIISAVLGFATLPFVAWFFSIEDVGRLAISMVIFGLSGSFIGLETHQAYVREYHEESNKVSLFKCALVPGIIIYVLVLVFVSLQFFSISDLVFGIDSDLLTALLLSGILATFLINMLAHVIRMQERAIVFSITQVVPKLFFLVLITSVLIFDVKSDFKLLLSMNIVSLLVTLLILLWFTRGTWLPGLTGSLNISLLKRMLKFCTPLIIGGFAYWGLTTMDRVFLRSISGFGELGIYSMAGAIGGSLFIISAVFSNMWHPIIYKWAKDGVEPEKIQTVIDYTFLAVTLLWTCFGMLSWLLPYFLPPEYAAVEYIVLACIAMPLFYLLSEATVVGIGITRKSKYATLASVIAFCVNIILNFLLTPKFGASGAAIASLSAFFVFFICRTEFSARLWYSFCRSKIYLITSMYCLNTIYQVIEKPESSMSYYFWLLLLAISVCLYRNRFVLLINALSRNSSKAAV